MIRVPAELEEDMQKSINSIVHNLIKLLKISALTTEPQVFISKSPDDPLERVVLDFVLGAAVPCLLESPAVIEVLDKYLDMSKEEMSDKLMEELTDMLKNGEDKND